MTTQLPTGGAPAHYPKPTEATFSQALKLLERSLPGHHAKLASLLADGRFHDVDAILAVLEGRDP
ncbi:MAG: hypothetical protein JNL21_06510 [Myxococcales bacterium]|nr:hypothetical protein [Myxococcales bacterium]